MDDLLRWLAVVGIGMMHGLSPTSGWTLAAGCGLRAGRAGRAWRALAPIALGHLASIAAVAVAVSTGLALDRTLARQLAGAVLVGMALLQLRHAPPPAAARPPRLASARLAAWSALMGTAHGAGLMLVPALAPLCLTGGVPGSVTAGGSLLLAGAALAAHLAAMLLTAGALAAGACHGAACCPALARSGLPRRVCAAALVLAGLWAWTGA